MDEDPDRLLPGAGGNLGTDTELVISDDFLGVLRSTGWDPDADILAIKVLLCDYTMYFARRTTSPLSCLLLFSSVKGWLQRQR